ncbi:MAG: DUF4173 domain-containing protein [Oscillospiraceae bacterium]|nr:DUF4173 domain-containing protein [Oscillospiraceae bacterium]
MEPYTTNPFPSPAPFPTGRREMILCCLAAVLGLAMANSILMGGFSLGFALTAVGSILASGWYLSVHREGNGYTRAILLLCLIIACGFGYSADSFVKFVLFLFLLTGVNLAFCQTAGQNRRNPGQFNSLFDAPRALLVLGVGQIGPAFRGIAAFFRNGSETSRRTGAILAGLAIALPVLGILIPLLMFADAAFEGLMDLLPDFNIGELIYTGFLGLILCPVLYTRTVALRHVPRENTPLKPHRGMHLFTVNTLLFSVCGLYLVYCFSQIAYFSGGFLGILPDGYSTAEYARRGFFEMAWLCAINLTIIGTAHYLVSCRGPVPRSTKIACLFIGLVTLFFVSASCAKMMLYISVYGLTRLRVLTMAVIAFLGIATVTICLWLFLPRLKYMKALVLIALVIGAAILWMDVDATVARYNVNAYLSGTLESVDMAHLCGLGDSALPHIARLTDCPDPLVARQAKDELAHRFIARPDLRSWNYMTHRAFSLAEGLRRTR